MNLTISLIYIIWEFIADGLERTASRLLRVHPRGQWHWSHAWDTHGHSLGEFSSLVNWVWYYSMKSEWVKISPLHYSFNVNGRYIGNICSFERIVPLEAAEAMDKFVSNGVKQWLINRISIVCWCPGHLGHGIWSTACGWFDAHRNFTWTYASNSKKLKV